MIVIIITTINKYHLPKVIQLVTIGVEFEPHLSKLCCSHFCRFSPVQLIILWGHGARPSRSHRLEMVAEVSPELLPARYGSAPPFLRCRHSGQPLGRGGLQPAPR